MKKIIFAFLMLGLVSCRKHDAHAVNKIDFWIDQSMKANMTNLLGAGEWACMYADSKENADLIAFGPSTKVACTRVQMQCMKNRCENFGKEKGAQIEKYFDLPDGEISDLMQAMGYSAAEITDTLNRRRNMNLKIDRSLNCLAFGATAKELVYDFCSLVPMFTTKEKL